LISGYMIGSPTRDSAQWAGLKPSSNLSIFTPGTPVEEYIMPFTKQLLLLRIHLHVFYCPNLS